MTQRVSPSGCLRRKPPEDTGVSGEGEVELPDETKDLVLATIWAITKSPEQYQAALNLAAAAIAHQQLKK